MAYRLNVTEHVDELLDNLVYHLVNRLKNKQAARHLLDSIEKHQATFHNTKFYWLNGRVTDRFCIDCTSRGSNGCFCFVLFW